MGRKTPVNFEATYNDSGTGLYRAGQADGAIDSSDHRTMITDIKDSFEPLLTVDYASTGNLPLTGSATFDGATPAIGSYILVKDQLVDSENAIYIRQSGAWTRWYNFQVGDFIRVRYGVTNARKTFYATSSEACDYTVNEGAMIEFVNLASHGYTFPVALTKGATASAWALINGTTDTQDDFRGIVYQIFNANNFSVALPGSRVVGLSGLSAGDIHYAQADGTIGLTPTNVKVLYADTATSGYILTGSAEEGNIKGTAGTNDNALVRADGTGGNTLQGTSIYSTDDGRLYGTALHNNAGSMTGTTNQYIGSGTYTPTLTNQTNLSASTAYVCQWIRVGNVVTVSGRVDIDPTAVGGFVLEMTLPISTNLSASTQAAGTFASFQTYNEFGAIARNTSNTVQFNGTSTTNVNHEIYFTFTYLVL